MPYKNPIEIFSIPVPEMETGLDFRKTKRRVLAAFELSEETTVRFGSLEMDKAGALLMLEELESPVRTSAYLQIIQNTSLHRFLKFGDPFDLPEPGFLDQIEDDEVRSEVDRLIGIMVGEFMLRELGGKRPSRVHRLIQISSFLPDAEFNNLVSNLRTGLHKAFSEWLPEGLPFSERMESAAHTFTTGSARLLTLVAESDPDVVKSILKVAADLVNRGEVTASLLEKVCLAGAAAMVGGLPDFNGFFMQWLNRHRTQIGKLEMDSRIILGYLCPFDLIGLDPQQPFGGEGVRYARDQFVSGIIEEGKRQIAYEGGYLRAPEALEICEMLEDDICYQRFLEVALLPKLKAFLLDPDPENISLLNKLPKGAFDSPGWVTRQYENVLYDLIYWGMPFRYYPMMKWVVEKREKWLGVDLEFVLDPLFSYWTEANVTVLYEEALISKAIIHQNAEWPELTNLLNDLPRELNHHRILIYIRIRSLLDEFYFAHGKTGVQNMIWFLKQFIVPDQQNVLMQQIMDRLRKEGKSPGFWGSFPPWQLLTVIIIGLIIIFIIIGSVVSVLGAPYTATSGSSILFLPEIR